MYTENQIREMINGSTKATCRALVSLFEQQTKDEQATESTNHRNGAGFNSVDAAFGSSLAKQVIAGRALSDKQIAAARKMLQKYVGQLTRIANSKAVTPAATEGAINDLMITTARVWVQAYNLSRHVTETGEKHDEVLAKYEEFSVTYKQLHEMLDKERMTSFALYLTNLVGITSHNVNPLHVAAVVVEDGWKPVDEAMDAVVDPNDDDDPAWQALKMERHIGDPVPHISAAEAPNEWAKKSGGRRPYRPVMAAH